MGAILADGKFMLFEETFRFQLVNIGPGNGLALSRHQANAWTNDYPVYWRHILGHNEFKKHFSKIALRKSSPSIDRLR